MPKQTPLYSAHLASGAKIVDFAGWDMPLHYGSQLEEHHQVRRDAGVFDVSHMLCVDVTGQGAQVFLQRLLANDVAKLKTPGKALYSCMLNHEGGVIDDLIVYYFAPDSYRIVVNAGTADKDVAWMRKQVAQSGANVDIVTRRDLAILAVQGPQARAKVWAALPGSQAISADLSVFSAVQFGDITLCRTGYTGEDGFELMVPAARAAEVWQALLTVGVKPVGLGARDTLRLEAGMNLYGQDMDEQISPLETGLAWTVDRKAERDFIGRAALDAQQVKQKLVGLVLQERGVLRSRLKVVTPYGEGETSSGSFSPTMNAAIALARVPCKAPEENMLGDEVQVDIRGKLVKARIVKLPFVRNGQVLV